ncbi:MAG TPA: trypsin-like peptidase domain-containing protein [Armatimonadota bacterium]|nr:trypsin-like peptidase domain-containing protein [Armatimonadota bacterium]
MHTRDALSQVSPAVVTVVCFNEKGEQTTQGSGVIVAPDGMVVTACHVIAGAAAARVTLPIGAYFEVEGLLARDTEADFAVLKVEGKDLPTAPLGDSDQVRQGDGVLTLGAPLGLEQTASEGMVSAVREAPEGGRRLQITAPISPGSSGGPVMNLRGEVIGVATFHMTEGQNLNFAVPINDVKPRLKDIGRVAPLTKAARKPPARVAPPSLAGSAQSLYQQGLAALPENYNAPRARGQLEQALALFRRALEERPEYLDAWLQAGCCLHSLGLWHDAVRAFKQAIRLGPGFADAHFWLGVVYARLRAREKAVDAFKEAIRLKPDFAEAHFHLALSYLGLMDYWNNPATKVDCRRAAHDELRILKGLSPDLAGQLFQLLDRT